jgi:short-subunit dehydrogenase
MARFNRPAAGSVAIVTGASAGIGREVARALAARGHVVLAVARRAERLAELAREAPAGAGAGAGRIEPLAVDVTAADAPERIHEAARRLGQIGWLVNNAGGSTFGRAEEAAVDSERAVVRLNCESVVALTTRVLPDLVRAGRGIVLHVASSAGLQPTPGWAVYGATKAFVISYSEALYEELRGSGVSSTALCPGPVATEFFAANAGAEAERKRKRPRFEISAQHCVAAGIQAALAGRAIAVVGGMNRFLALAGALSPRAITRWVSAKTSLKYIGLPPMPPRPPRPP